MAETIDEARIIAWIDGELSPDAAAEVAARVAQDDVLAMLADRHRAMKRRFAAAFGQIAGEEVRVASPQAEVISMADVRARRAGTQGTPRWAWPGAIAASLLVGLFVGHQGFAPGGIGDRPGALVLDHTIAGALDTQLSGDGGPIRIALSFRDKAGAYCRSFTGNALSGVACRDGKGWTLRYATNGAAPAGAYRMAGSDGATMSAIGGMIAGDPLDRSGEISARRDGWR